MNLQSVTLRNPHPVRDYRNPQYNPTYRQAAQTKTHAAATSTFRSRPAPNHRNNLDPLKILKLMTN